MGSEPIRTEKASGLSPTNDTVRAAPTERVHALYPKKQAVHAARAGYCFRRSSLAVETGASRSNSNGVLVSWANPTLGSAHNVRPAAFTHDEPEAPACTRL